MHGGKRRGKGGGFCTAESAPDKSRVKVPRRTGGARGGAGGGGVIRRGIRGNLYMPSANSYEHICRQTNSVGRSWAWPVPKHSCVLCSAASARRMWTQRSARSRPRSACGSPSPVWSRRPCRTPSCSCRGCGSSCDRCGPRPEASALSVRCAVPAPQPPAHGDVLKVIPIHNPASQHPRAGAVHSPGAVHKVSAYLRPKCSSWAVSCWGAVRERVQMAEEDLRPDPC